MSGKQLVLFVPPSQVLRGLLKQYASRYELLNIKALVRGKIGQLPNEEIERSLFNLPGFLSLNHQDLLNTDNVPELLRRLKNTRYRGLAVQALRQYEERPDPFLLDATLDQQFYSELIGRAQLLTSTDRAEILELIGRIVDRHNLVWSLRYRFNYGLQASEVLYLAIDGGRVLSRTHLQQILRADTLNEAIRHLPEHLLGRGQMPARIGPFGPMCRRIDDSDVDHGCGFQDRQRDARRPQRLIALVPCQYDPLTEIRVGISFRQDQNRGAPLKQGGLENGFGGLAAFGPVGFWQDHDIGIAGLHRDRAGQGTYLGDRRFHAEPVACPQCGPSLTYEAAGKPAIAESNAALDATVAAIAAGQVVAVKGIGGYHLVCDARSEAAVDLLRQRKRRPHKPLAVMFPLQGPDGLDAVRQHVLLTTPEAELVTGPMRPIVLAKRQPGDSLAANIAPGLGEIGVFLPYSPLHVLLSEGFDGPLVATSANISGEPVLTDNRDVEQRLAQFVRHVDPRNLPSFSRVLATVRPHVVGSHDERRPPGGWDRS